MTLSAHRYVSGQPKEMAPKPSIAESFQKTRPLRKALAKREAPYLSMSLPPVSNMPFRIPANVST